jgi:esterase/lipase superfamily enzyme
MIAPILSVANYGKAAVKYISLLLYLFVLATCAPAPNLTLTPTLYLNQKYPAEVIPKQLQTTQPKLYYVTDRFLSDEWTNREPYSSKRSPSMALGEVTMSFGKNKSWEELVKSSNTVNRKDDYQFNIIDADEIIRFPSTPLSFTVVNGQIKPVIYPGYKVYQKRKKQFKKILADLLTKANGKEVVLFVHGYKDHFEDAAYSMADLWHFSGRIGVPIFFTWPAGAGGLFGYLKDRESGEYAVYHLKETLRLIADTPGLEKVHIIAHSRGAGVVTTAMRELIIETRAAGQSARKKFKVANLILAAPDLDFGVVRQRLVAEKFGPAFGQISVYMNQNDSALKLAQRVMTGSRFGRLSPDKLDEIDKRIFANLQNVNFIDIENVNSSIGHDYFISNPSVLSDIALTLQTSARPGGKVRPLLHVSGNFWHLSKFYPYDIPIDYEGSSNKNLQK